MDVASFTMLHPMHLLEEIRFALPVFFVTITDGLIKFANFRRVVLLDASNLIPPFFFYALYAVLLFSQRNWFLKEHLHWHFSFLAASIARLFHHFQKSWHNVCIVVLSMVSSLSRFNRVGQSLNEFLINIVREVRRNDGITFNSAFCKLYILNLPQGGCGGWVQRVHFVFSWYSRYGLRLAVIKAEMLGFSFVLVWRPAIA